MAKKTDSFENSLQELERVVAHLEKGETPLEDQLKAFEKGVGLSRQCLERLEAIEQRVEKLVQDSDGTLNPQPLDKEG